MGYGGSSSAVHAAGVTQVSKVGMRTPTEASALIATQIAARTWKLCQRENPKKNPLYELPEEPK
jgi:hypothetical protein